MYKCDNWAISRAQRTNEIARGDGLSGTRRYADMGCYNCDGHKTCPSYFSSRESHNEGIMRKLSRHTLAFDDLTKKLGESD